MKNSPGCLVPYTKLRLSNLLIDRYGSDTPNGRGQGIASAVNRLAVELKAHPLPVNDVARSSLRFLEAPLGLFDLSDRIFDHDGCNNDAGHGLVP